MVNFVGSTSVFAILYGLVSDRKDLWGNIRFWVLSWELSVQSEIVRTFLELLQDSLKAVNNT